MKFAVVSYWLSCIDPQVFRGSLDLCNNQLNSVTQVLTNQIASDEKKKKQWKIEGKIEGKKCSSNGEKWSWKFIFEVLELVVCIKTFPKSIDATPWVILEF